ncbi:MAG: hypothetical protein Q9214_006139 [Letrouitia sp. 1 TL-2023]
MFEERVAGEFREQTKNLTGLAYNTIAIHDARSSLNYSASMQRLSLITFIFLPLMIIAVYLLKPKRRGEGGFAVDSDTSSSGQARTWIPIDQALPSGLVESPASPEYESASSKFSKRDSGDRTYVTYGDGSVDFGSTRASQISGAIRYLYDACHEGACDTSDKVIGTRVASDPDEHDTTLILHPIGQCGGWDQRNVFVKTMVAAVAQGEQCETKK